MRLNCIKQCKHLFKLLTSFRDISRPILGPNMGPVPNPTNTQFFPISNLIYPKLLLEIPNPVKLM